MSDIYSDRLFNGLSKTPPEAGMLLVSAPGMVSAELTRSVIFLLDVGPDGAVGVDPTERTEMATQNVLPQWTPLITAPQVIYLGGPVGHNTVLAVGVAKPDTVIGDTTLFSTTAHRFVTVNLDADPDEVKGKLHGLRMFGGYAGWGPGQLNAEIERGNWYVAPALTEDVLAPANVDVWGQVMRRQEQPLPLFATYPIDPNEN